MKRLLLTALSIVLGLVFADALVLFAALAQIALEGKTGYWNPFWRTQAEWILRMLL